MVFELFQKLHLQFMQASYDIIYYFTSFESRKCGKEEKKLQKFEYLENAKRFLGEIKKNFHSFWRAVIWCKIKILIKNSGHKLSSFSFFTPSNGTQISFMTTRQISNAPFILVFVSIVIYTSLFRLTCLYLFTLTYLYLCSLYTII